jgi:hypothetical protein
LDYLSVILCWPTWREQIDNCVNMKPSVNFVKVWPINFSLHSLLWWQLAYPFPDIKAELNSHTLPTSRSGMTSGGCAFQSFKVLDHVLCSLTRSPAKVVD